MIKRKTIMILFTAMLLTQVLVLQPTLSKVALNGNDTPSIQSVAQPIISMLTPDGPGGTEKVKTNIFVDGGCEKEDIDGAPSAFFDWGSGYAEANHSYQDEVHTGSYGGYLSTQGTYQYQSSAQSSRFIPSIPELTYLDEKITLDFWYNAKANPNFTQGAEIYFRIRFTTDLGNHYLYYMLSRVSGMPGNSSTTAYIDVRGSLDSWTNIVRNLTYDFEDAFSTGADLSISYVRYLYFHVTSIQDASGDTIMLYDDVTMTNDTGFNYLHQNGDFEDGNSGSWGDYENGPGSVYRTGDDFTEGSHAMNMTVASVSSDSSGFAYAEKDIYAGWSSVPKGYYVKQPGDLTFSFDWKYSDTAGLGTQRAQFYINAMNDTFSGTIQFHLGDENDDKLSYSNYTGVNYATYNLFAENFGSRDTWNNFFIDYHILMASLNLTNQIAYYLGFYVDGGYYENGKIQLLVDDFHMTTYPAPDPSFENNIFFDPVDPIMLWQTPYDDDYVNITTDAHTGNYAANLSSYLGYTNVYCRRNTFLPIVNNLFTDFWWRLDSMTDTGNMAYTDIRLRIDGTRLIHYVLGNNSLYTLTNNSNDCYFFVEGHNQIGSWNNIFRDLNKDVTAAFGAGNWNVTQIDMACIAQGTEEAIVIIDDIDFVRDIEGPQYSNLLQDPATPEYGQAVDVSIDIIDNILIQDVEFYYKISSSSWGTSPVSVVGNTFTGTIPAAGYGETAYYYFLALDAYSHVTQWGSEATPFTYVVGDFTDPVLELEVPPETQTLNGTILLNITDAYDLGSGLASFVIILNDTVVHDSLTFPESYSWNTDVFGNQEYTIIFRIEDNAGNIVEEVYVYNVYNPLTGWETFKAFMIKWGPYIGGGAGALLIGILVIVIVVRRKKKLA